MTTTSLEVVAVVKQILINRAELAVEDYPVEFVGTESSIVVNSTVPRKFTVELSSVNLSGSIDILQYSNLFYNRTERIIEINRQRTVPIALVKNFTIPVNASWNNVVAYGTDHLGDSSLSEINFTSSTTFGFRVGEYGTVESQYLEPGTYSWTCPNTVTSVNVVCIGGGGGGAAGAGNGGAGGGGGGLGWKNNITVTPGQSYTVVVGAGGQRNVFGVSPATDGGDSYFIDPNIVKGGGGQGAQSELIGGVGGNYVGDGGGNGGSSKNSTISDSTGGGGAGGYTGNGGDAGDINVDNAQPGSGGGGGGGGAGGSSDAAGAGGGVGIFGQGDNGLPGVYNGADGTSGTGGSGGEDGSAAPGSTARPSTGGKFGGGGGGAEINNEHGNGGSGAVRIMANTGQSFPTNASLVDGATGPHVPGDTTRNTTVEYNYYDPIGLKTETNKIITVDKVQSSFATFNFFTQSIVFQGNKNRDSVTKDITRKEIYIARNDLTYNLIQITPTNISISVKDTTQELGFFVDENGQSVFAVLTDSNDPRAIEVPGVLPRQTWF